MEYIGTITKARGFRGDMFISDVPNEIQEIKKGADIIVGFSSTFGKNLTIQSFNKKGKNTTVKFNEINSDLDVIKLKEQGIFTDKSNINIDKEKNALIDEIVGCQIIDIDTNELIGKIIEVWYLPGNDVYYTRTPKGNIPIPVIDEVIIKTDLVNDKIYVHFIDGLWTLLEETDKP